MHVLGRAAHAQVILPSDFVVGDIEVDENGPLPGQVVPGDADDDNGDDDGVADENGNKSDDGDGNEPNDSGSAAGSGGGGGQEITGITASAAVDLEPEDEAMGFEYDGEVRKRKGRKSTKQVPITSICDGEHVHIIERKVKESRGSSCTFPHSCLRTSGYFECASENH